jgi:hypothetical protein
MNWSLQWGTCPAAHLPDDAQMLCMCMFFHIVHSINFYNIPPGLVINMDQTGIILLMSKNHTYSEKGGQQVDIAGMDEK